MSMKATTQKHNQVIDLFILSKWQVPVLAFTTLNDCFGMDRIREYCQTRGVRVVDLKKGGAHA